MKERYLPKHDSYFLPLQISESDHDLPLTILKKIAHLITSLIVPLYLMIDGAQDQLTVLPARDERE